MVTSVSGSVPCQITEPASTLSLFSSVALPVRPALASSASASVDVLPTRSGTFTVSSGFLPCETTMVMVEPLDFFSPALGFCSITLSLSSSESV